MLLWPVVVACDLGVFVCELLLDPCQVLEGRRAAQHSFTLSGATNLPYILIVCAPAFWKDGLEEVRLAHIDLADHPACAATVPYFLFDLLCPPSALCADQAYVAQTGLVVVSTQCIAEDLGYVGHERVDLLLLGRQQIGSCDDEAHFCDAVVGHPALVFGATVLRSQFGYTQRGLKVGDDGEGEIGSVDDMVDVVSAVGRLCDGLLD